MMRSILKLTSGKTNCSRTFIVPIGIFFVLLCLCIVGVASAQTPIYVTNWSTSNEEYLAINSSGFVYTTSTFSDIIKVYTPSGVLVNTWGSKGSGNNQLSYPYGITVNASGYVYVADSNNSRIVEYTSSGIYVTQWGSNGTEQGQFWNPMGVAVSPLNGNVYVADTYNHRIQEFTPSGDYLTQFGAPYLNWEGPLDLAVDSNGNVYAVRPTDDNVGDHTIYKFNSDGTLAAQWGAPGSGNGQISDPQAIGLDSSGNVYVTDISDRIQEFTSSGTYLMQWGSSGSGNYQFDGPMGIAFSPVTGNVYICDVGNGRIIEYQLTYVSKPVVTGLDPSMGEMFGGTSVTISGSGFTGATAINFGSVPVTTFTVISDSSITVMSPATTSPTGMATVDVTVTTPGGTSNINPPADQFTYFPVPPPPTFTSAETNTAGTQINITFDDAMRDPIAWDYFSYKDNGVTGTFTSAALDPSNNAIIDLTTSSPIIHGDVVTVSYDYSGSPPFPVVSADDSPLEAFTDEPVTNNVPAPVPMHYTAHSPVYLTVTDPDGNSISCSGNPGSVTNSILPANTATYTGCSADPSVDGTVTIPDPIPGNYQVTVTPKPGASATSVYTVTLTQGATTTTLASGVPVSDIPSAPYQDVVTSSGVIGTTPTITWSNPADISYGTALSGTQLDATSSVPGSFAYTPLAGTVLGVGSAQTLSTLFTPTDITDYNTASANVVINVDPAPSTTAVSSSENPSSYGDTVTFTADVTPTTATGTVQFKIDGSPVGSAVTLSNGEATSGGISTLTVGTHTVEADYSGDTNDAPSIGTLTPVQQVNAEASSTTVSSSLNPSALGQPVSFTATVSPATATGTVQFLIDGTDLGTPVTVSGGTATSTSTSTLIDGTHTIEADYNGDTNDLASSGTVIQTVSSPQGLSSSKNPSTYGDTVMFAVKLKSSIATGSVQFMIDGANFGSPVTVSGGMATSGQISTLAVGHHIIKASYSGDANNPAGSWTLSQTVKKIPTSVTVTPAPNPSVY
jgi:sugar lactone lactonase YvrE